MLGHINTVFPNDFKEFIIILVCAKTVFSDVANEKPIRLLWQGRFKHDSS